MQGSIPVLTVRGKSLAEAWENSMLSLWKNGAEARTQYDRKDKDGNYIDPPSKDCTMLIVVEEPFSDPMIHRAFPGGLEDLEEYRMEVVDGIKDHWVRDPNDPTDERWEYTYHGRLTRREIGTKILMSVLKDLAGNISHEYPATSVLMVFNQLDWLVNMLAKDPITRRAIAHTWIVGEDNECSAPPCLQGIWVRAIPNPDGQYLVLNMDVRFRSRDAYDAAYMNCFAFIHLMRDIADKLEEKIGMQVRLGRYVDFSDSYHIYGRRMEDFQERFMKLYKERSFEDRTWPLSFAQPIFDEARPKILEKVAAKDRADKK